MKRFISDKLIEWKNSPQRKPLLLQGARQVGKTWAINEFARTEFDDIAYIDFLVDEDMEKVFEGSLRCDRLIEAIALHTNANAGDSNVLVVFDEVQECPRALVSLKTFAQERPDIPIIAAGSLLGVALHGESSDISFPVGKVDHLFMHPMTFKEYLIAVGQDRMASLLDEGDESLLDSFAERFIDELRHYYFIGGMPEAVKIYADTHDLKKARDVQTRLLRDYELDFAKHTHSQTTERIRLVWQALPAQLARQNKKFVYSALRSGARAREYGEPIQWLVDAGLVLRVNRITKPGVPLSSYMDRNAFKLYFFDTGLLGAACHLDASSVISGSDLFTEFKGALTENFACQEFIATEKIEPYYWSAENSSGEIDFVYEWEGHIVPVEVKANVNLKAKSLRIFVEQNGIDYGLRLSLTGFMHQSWVVNIPLYAADLLPDRI